MNQKQRERERERTIRRRGVNDGREEGDRIEQIDATGRIRIRI